MGWDVDGDGDIDPATACTGTVIAPQWVVSAAHCAFRPDGQPIQALVTLTGTHDKTGASGGEAISADRIVVNPNWNPQALLGDALLIHLRTPSSRPAMPLARLGGQYDEPAGVPNAAGWGTIDENSTIGTDVLREAYLALQDDQTCESFASEFDGATQTCAGTPNTAGACEGDSGGPLVVFDQASGAPALWGLTSYGGLGPTVCSLQAPAVFTWVPAFAAWVDRTIRPPVAPPPPPPPPVIRPPADTTPPAITNARLSTRRIRAARRGATISRRRGATLSFRLSEGAAVTVTVLRKRGRRFRAMRPSVPLAASAGRVRRRFSGRLDGRALRRGSYKLQLRAVDLAANRAAPVRLAFRIVRR